MKRTYILLLVFVIVISFFHVKSSRDISMRNLCLCVMISRNNANDSYKFIIETASLSNKSIGEEFDYLDVFHVTGVGSTYEKGRLDYESKVSNPIFLGTVKTVIFDKTLAEYGILGYLNRIKGLTDYRKNLIPCVSLDSLDGLVKRELFKGTSFGFNTEAILKYQDLIGRGIISTAGEIFSLKSDSDVGYILPVIKVENNMLQFYGQAIFKDNKMIEYKKIKECNGLNYILNKNFIIKKSVKYDKYPDNYYSIDISRKKLNIRTDYYDGIPQIYINLHLNAKFKFQYIDYPMDKDDIVELEKSISLSVIEEIRSIVTESQEKHQCDILNMKKYFRTYNFDVLRDHDWKELFPKARFHINVKTDINDLSLVDTNR